MGIAPFPVSKGPGRRLAQQPGPEIEIFMLVAPTARRSLSDSMDARCQWRTESVGGR